MLRPWYQLCLKRRITLFNTLPSFSLISASWNSNWNLIQGISVFIETNIEPAWGRVPFLLLNLLWKFWRCLKMGKMVENWRAAMTINIHVCTSKISSVLFVYLPLRLNYLKIKWTFKQFFLDVLRWQICQESFSHFAFWWV